MIANTYNIRLAETCDIESINKVYACARAFMKSHNNPTQWGDNYPTLDIIERDIENSYLYVVEINNEINGAFALIKGEDPTYLNIYEGAWIDDSAYSTIHRLASSGKYSGIFKLVVEYSLKEDHHLRIDTHEDNLVMQHLILKAGFKYTGIIYTIDDTKRLAYEISI